MELEKLKEKLKKVKVLITDVDGVLTDGSLYIGNGGNEFKRFNVLDGAGIALLKAADIPLV
ncbi:MAG: 3-deoxy-D-manno-octulosonate 8-phosphate phosphatase, partial [Candidatus Neomarinimicrobiota bacterium]